jgi:hypothetical protein
MGVQGTQDIMDSIEKKRLQWYGHVKRIQEERIPKLIMEWTPPTSSHGNKEFGTKSVEKQRGMEFCLWKMETAVMKSDR